MGTFFSDHQKIACIYPCDGRTRTSKVPSEAYRSHEDFDVFHVQIGHSEPLLEQFDRRRANFSVGCQLPPFCATEYFFSDFKSFKFFIHLLSKSAENFIEIH